jgi:predicted GH43/DUF377 family glycosyl hydrolase
MAKPDLLEGNHMSISIINHATSGDGLRYENRKPFIVPTLDFEKYGCEDPRVTKVDDTYYIFYTALSKYPYEADNIRIAVALSRDMETVDEKHLVTPFNAKAMALFPELIDGKMVALLTPNTDRPPSEIALATFDKREDMWSEDFWKTWYEHLGSHVIPLRRENDDQVELGAPPVKTDAGWLVIYSHITHYTDPSRRTFGVEAVLLDLENPHKIISRTKMSFFSPETYYERVGLIPNIVFPSGVLLDGDTLEIHYGAADTHCCKATVSLRRLLRSMASDTPPIFTRSDKNPILTPREGKPWEALGVFNPAAIDIDGTIHIYYRAATMSNVSTFGYAASRDGVHIDARSEDPVYVARVPAEGVGHEAYAGCEDPRIVRIDERLYMTYTGYDSFNPVVMVSSIAVKDFAEGKHEAWSLPVAISPPNVPDKDACIFPRKLPNGYLLFHRIAHHLCAGYIDKLEFSPSSIDFCIDVLGPRPGMWDGVKVGISGPPIETERGWLLFYHGISEKGEYKVGAVLLDKDEPTVVLGRTAAPLFEPVEEYEKTGIIPNVVFPCGNVLRDGTIYMYYGGADYVVGVATASLDEILDILTN